MFLYIQHTLIFVVEAKETRSTPGEGINFLVTGDVTEKITADSLRKRQTENDGST